LSLKRINILSIFQTNRESVTFEEQTLEQQKNENLISHLLAIVAFNKDTESAQEVVFSQGDLNSNVCGCIDFKLEEVIIT